MDLRITPAEQTVVRPVAETRAKDVQADFAFTLRRLGAEGLSERLQGLVDDIKASGSRLAEHMDVSDMKHYRAVISEFIGEVVTNTRKFSRENVLDRRGRHRVYGIIRLINRDLDELAKELLKQEKDHIGILEKTDEIIGLLLDLLV